MKKLFLVMLSAFALVACHNNDIEPMSTQEVVTNNYNAVFVKTFGEPAANQDWGFGSRVLPTSFGAVTRTANTNGNQWGTDYGYTVPSPITAAEREAAVFPRPVFGSQGEREYEGGLHLHACLDRLPSPSGLGGVQLQGAPSGRYEVQCDPASQR